MEQVSDSPESPFPSSLSMQVRQSLVMPSLVVSKETPVSALPHAIDGNRDCQTIAVVDDAGVLVGIIPVDTVLEDILLRVVPEEFLSDVREMERVAELMKEQQARTAGALMHPPVSVRAGATVREALHSIHRAEARGLPVVDERGHVSGYIGLLQLLLAWLEGQPPPSPSR